MSDEEHQDQGERFGVVGVPFMWRHQLDRTAEFAAHLLEEQGPPEQERDVRELFDTASLKIAHVAHPEPPGKDEVDVALEDPDGLQWIWLEFATMQPKFGVNPEVETFPRIGAAGCPRHFERYLWLRTGMGGWTVELVGRDVRVMVPRRRIQRIGVSIRKINE